MEGEVRDALAREWLRCLSVLDGGEAIIGAAARELNRAEPIEAARALGCLIDAAADDGRVSRVLGALIGALTRARPEDLPDEARDRIAAAAEAFGIAQVTAVFVSGAPMRTLNEGETPQADPTMAGVSLGHKRERARSVNPDRAARWAAESDPSVIRNFLLNPRITEDLVVRVAARRPARAETLREIWESRRWSVRRRVRLALASSK